MIIKACWECGKRFIIGRRDIDGQRVCSAKCRREGERRFVENMCSLEKHMQWCIKQEGSEE